MASPPEPTSPFGRLLYGLTGLGRRSKQRAHSRTVVKQSGEELSLEKNLERRRLSQAAQQLITREERLFGETPGGRGEVERLFGGTPGGRGEVERLAADRTAFTSLLRQTLSRSLTLGAEDVEILRSAVEAICQDEEQDGRWKGREGSQPDWRPGGFRNLHDAVLKELVEERMDGASSPGDGAGLSSVQRDICNLLWQLREDLVRVVRVVKGCYPVEMDICNLYGRLYHQAFSSRLTTIAEFGLGDEDCRALLRCVNSDFPHLLRAEDLRAQVHSDILGALLPQHLYSPLETQFFSATQEKVRTYLNLILKEEEKLWKGGGPATPKDGCFFSTLAIDVLQCVDGAVTATECILGDQRKATRLVCLISEVLESVRSFLTDEMQRSTESVRPLLLALLPCFRQFRVYVVKKADLFPDHGRERCLRTLSSLKETAHTCLLSPVHKALKPHYGPVGTSCWLKQPAFDGLLDRLAPHLRELQGLSEPCREELGGQLQVEVTLEYVKRLMMGNLRLKNIQDQEQVAQMVSEDSKRLANMFSGVGCREVWLHGIMSQIGEVLRLRELPSIQMVVVSMGMTYPDLSSKHVSSLLRLKSGLSQSDMKKVQEVLEDCRKENVMSEPTPPPFFSKIHLK